MKRWFRSEVRDIERVPAEGGVLIVSNHSGGLMPMDVPIIAVAFHDEFGDRAAALHAGPRHAVHRLDRDHDAPGRLRRGHPRERRGGARARRGDHRLPRWRLRQLPADPEAERHRLRGPHRLRPHRAGGRRTDRARGEHRRPGAAAVPLARRAAGQVAAAGEAHAHRLHAGGAGLPVRTDLRVPAQPAAAHQDRHPGARPDRPRRDRGRVRRGAGRRRRVDEEIRRRMQVALDELAEQRRFPVLG